MLSVLAAVLLAPTSLTFAVGDADISPPELLPLGGYTERHGARMIGIGDHLHARALLLTSGSFRVAIVSVETLTIPASLVTELEARLPGDLHLVVCATHTHCAPDSQMLNRRMTIAIPGIASYSRSWTMWYADHIAAAVVEAYDAPAQPVSRLVAESWTADLNRARRKFATPDQTATLVSTWSRQPLFFEYAAHGTFYDADEERTRGDWPGKVGQLAPLALIGPIGDVSPKAPHLDHAPAAQRISAFWRAMLAARHGSTAAVEWQPNAPITLVTEPIPLGPPTPHPDAAKQYKSLARIFVNRFAPTTASITALRLGDLAIVGVPGEPTSALGRQIAIAGRRAGFWTVLVLSHCNGWMGYILDPEDYDRGGYEATLSFYGRDEGKMVVGAAERALRRLRGG